MSDIFTLEHRADCFKCWEMLIKDRKNVNKDDVIEWNQLKCF